MRYFQNEKVLFQVVLKLSYPPPSKLGLDDFTRAWQDLARLVKSEPSWVMQMHMLMLQQHIDARKSRFSAFAQMPPAMGGRR